MQAGHEASNVRHVALAGRKEPWRRVGSHPLIGVFSIRDGVRSPKARGVGLGLEERIKDPLEAHASSRLLIGVLSRDGVALGLLAADLLPGPAGADAVHTASGHVHQGAVAGHRGAVKRCGGRAGGGRSMPHACLI